jgi:hypothetical protein
MSPASRAAAILTALASILLAGEASAQTEAERAAARELATSAQEALDRRDYAAAADRFERAAAIVHAPTVQLGLARAQVGLGRWQKALETYRRIVKTPVAAGAPGVFHQAARDAKREHSALEPRMPSLQIEVRGAPGPRVTLDGAPVDPATLGAARPADPGAHVIRAEAEGFATAEQSVTLMERGSATVALSLRPRATVVAPAPPPAAGGPWKILGFSALGLGAGGLVLGAATGIVALGKHADLAKVCPQSDCAGHAAEIKSFHAMATTSTVGFVAGATFAAAGVVALVLAPRAPAGTAQFTPILGPGYAGLAGSFR